MTPTRPCPACGEEWPDDIRYCGACGGRMPDATLVASPYTVQVEASAAPNAVEADAGRLASLHPDPVTLETKQRVDLDVFPEAWDIVRRRLGIFAVGTLVVGLAAAALCGTGVGVLALGPLQGGLALVGLRAASGRSVVLNDFFDGFALWKGLLWSGLLVTLLVLLGLVLLVLPGIYLMFATLYTPFLVVDRRTPAWEAVRTSLAVVRADLGVHLALFSVLMLVNVAGALLCGFGLLLTIPLSATAVALCYGRVIGFRS